MVREVACHEVDSEYLAQALDDIRTRAFGRWHDLRYGYTSGERLRTMRDELLDHVAAGTAGNALPDRSTRAALRTAAECDLGLLSVGCFPNGDQEITFSFLDEKLSSDDLILSRLAKVAPNARTWVDTFAICTFSGLIDESRRMVAPLLVDDFAPEIRAGVPHSELISTSAPADLAEMDALCAYVARPPADRPRTWPTAPLCAPDAGERAQAAAKLDGAGPLTPDQRLLRVLLDDDRPAFEAALASRLVQHRDGQEPDPAPRTLLPLGTLALVTLARRVHGWEPDVRSGYVPTSLLSTPTE
ncbi:immunity 49 family protein [Streptomyces sp. NPDC088097]|uniref:immunity 49 family protein n=1 Tax=Streptomyces sp. NPDC088097 TaxID=3365823 RepID=UPI00381EF1E0